MQLDHLTIKAQEALQDAQAHAQNKDHQRLEPEHLFVALLDQADGLVGQLLEKVGLAPTRVRAPLGDTLTKFLSVSGGSLLYLSARRNRLLLQADEKSKRLTDEYISTEHVLIAGFNDEELGALFKQLGFKRESIEAALKSLRGAHRVTDANPEEKYRSLERFARDLTDLARKGKLDPIIGRDRCDVRFKNT